MTGTTTRIVKGFAILLVVVGLSGLFEIVPRYTLAVVPIGVILALFAGLTERKRRHLEEIDKKMEQRRRATNKCVGGARHAQKSVLGTTPRAFSRTGKGR